MKYENFTTYLNEAGKIKPGDYVVIHTSYAYTPAITVVKGKEFDEYFSEDQGYEEDFIKAVKKLGTGRSYEYEGVVVVKV